jgi:hypothetical protein
MLALYAAAGGTGFVIQAWLLAQRGRRMGHPAGLRSCVRGSLERPNSSARRARQVLPTGCSGP